ncbi:hypothetical protein BDV12DRAFT_199085 [Aspergillus spectabilis]
MTEGHVSDNGCIRRWAPGTKKTYSLLRFSKIPLTCLPRSDSNSGHALSQLKHEPSLNTVHKELKHLIEADGAGSWPLRAVHGDVWFEILQPYHEIYLKGSPFLATEDVVVDDVLNTKRCNSFNTGGSPGTSDGMCFQLCDNGFYTCIAKIQHAYRWGIIPVVKAAQEQKILDLPAELGEPWTILRQRFGVTSLGGNIMANHFCNFDEEERIVYQI